jgi:hypothetical protein
VTTDFDPHVRLLDDARQADAVAERVRRRLLLDADAQDGTFRGTLEGLAEDERTVLLLTAAGRQVQGRVRALAADHVVLTDGHGTFWVRLANVTVLRVPDGWVVRPGGGERAPRPPIPLRAALRVLVEEGAEVEVVLSGGDVVRGTAAAAGRDVLTVRDGSGEHAFVHLDRCAVIAASDR